MPEKLAWILSEQGHGREWARVLRIGPDDTERFWEAIKRAVIDVPISTIRDLSPHGLNCEVRATITLGARITNTLTAWHYAGATDPPRLVTAHPIP